jgi:hypothetical protein
MIPTRVDLLQPPVERLLMTVDPPIIPLMQVAQKFLTPPPD